MVTNILLEGKYAWYSYDDKQTRPLRVMARNLHHLCNPGRIVSDLKTRGFKVLVIDAANKLKWRSKEPLEIVNNRKPTYALSSISSFIQILYAPTCFGHIRAIFREPLNPSGLLWYRSVL
jgi:hypothetical protein